MSVDCEPTGESKKHDSGLAHVCAMSIPRDCDVPAPGDLLIRSDEDGTHSVSVVPNADILRFKEFIKVFQLAMRWANDHQGDVWRKSDGIVIRVFRARTNQKDPLTR